MEFNLINVLLVFIATVFSDIVWAYYFIKVAQKKPHQSAMFAILIALNSSFITISYVSNMYFMIPVILGSYLGTYIAVKRHIKYDKSEEKIIELEDRIISLQSTVNDLDNRLTFIEVIKNNE